MRGRDDVHTVPSYEVIFQYVCRDKQQVDVIYVHLQNHGRHFQTVFPPSIGENYTWPGWHRPPSYRSGKSGVFGDLEIGMVVSKYLHGGLLTINDRYTGCLWIRGLLTCEAAEVAAVTYETLDSS